MRVLGLDTSLRSTGYGVVESAGHALKLVEQGTIRIPQGRPLSDCLATLDRQLHAILQRARPDAASIEGIFFCKNVKTAVILGEARGVVIARCADAGVPVFEYPPRRVKQAIVGHGAAGKQQVGRMVVRLLALEAEPQEDAADALAIAICHAHSRTGLDALRNKPL